MISASFINHTLTQPVARVAEIADAKEKAAKDRAVRVLTDERMSPLEDLQKCEEHFQKVSAYVEARREIISHAKGARIFPDAIPEDVWKSLDILCRTAPAMYLEARLKVTIGVIADAYKRKGMVRPSVHDHRLVPDASWVKTDSDVRKYIKQLRALPDGSRKRFPAVVREYIARASMKLPIPVVADRFGVSACYVGEARREFKEKQGVERYAAEVICESLQLGAKPQGTVPAASTTAAPYAAAKGRDIPRNTASAPNEDVPF